MCDWLIFSWIRKKLLKVKVFKLLRKFFRRVTNTKKHKGKKDHDLNYIQLQLPTFMRKGYIVLPYAETYSNTDVSVSLILIYIKRPSFLWYDNDSLNDFQITWNHRLSSEKNPRKSFESYLNCYSLNTLGIIKEKNMRSLLTLNYNGNHHSLL